MGETGVDLCRGGKGSPYRQEGLERCWGKARPSGGSGAGRPLHDAEHRVTQLLDTPGGGAALSKPDQSPATHPLLAGTPHTPFRMAQNP